MTEVALEVVLYYSATPFHKNNCKPTYTYVSRIERINNSKSGSFKFKTFTL